MSCSIYKRASTLGNGFAGENKAASEVKIRSFTRGSGSTIPGKIYENPAAITINTGAEVPIVRKGLVRAEDLAAIPETIRLKTVTGKSTPIMGEGSVEICIGQLRIRHRVLVASMEDDFILGMNLISRHGLTIDPIYVLEMKSSRVRCTEASQNCKHCYEVEQPKTWFNRRKKAVVEDDE